MEQKNDKNSWWALYRVRLYVLISCLAAFTALLTLWAGDFRRNGWRPAWAVLICLICACLTTLSVDGYRRMKAPALGAVFLAAILVVALLMAAIGAMAGA